MDIPDEPLVRLLSELSRRRYRFITPTPATHKRVIARPGRSQAHDLAGVFGWNLPFAADLLDPSLQHWLCETGVIERCGETWRSKVRVSSLGGDLFAHSAFPTTEGDAVFFGPDSYRFAALIEAELARAAPGNVGSVLDIGTGSGVGAIVAAQHSGAARIVGTDINPDALRFARINAEAAHVRLETRDPQGDVRRADRFDLVLANPPYIIDPKGREYRDGGALHGGEVSLEMAEQAVARLSDAGRFVLYTGSSIVGGEDQLKSALTVLAERTGLNFRYREIDPDVFGEELDGEAYRDVDRIAVIAAVFTRTSLA